MLGAGRFGKVYRARRYLDNATVALKYLRKPYLSEPDVVERFIQEAGTLAGLDHAGIVGVQGLGKTAAENYFLVMDWIDGPNLAEILCSGLPSTGRIVRWMVSLCRSLEHAHDRGILHCDLKPSNLLVDRNDAIHVTDFGLARPLVGDPELDGRIEGTPAFMAPEQASASWGSIGTYTDVYGLGAVCYALLTGRAPRGGCSRQEVLNEILAPTPVIDPRLSRPEISAELSRICLRCLASKSAARYQTMRKLRLALEKVV
jgi:eukaryotic-like serine/threonine-protein kinase